MTIGAWIRTTFLECRRRHAERKRLRALEDLLRGLDRHTREDIRFIHDSL